MKNKYANQLGFTVVETLLIVLILAVIGFGGYYVWHAQHHKNASPAVVATSTSNKTASTPKTPSNPYAGWKTAALKYEKISYQYPADWTVTDKSVTDGCVTPGSDDVYVTSPSGDQVELHTGVSCIGDGGSTSFGTAIPVNALGQSLYIAFENWSGTGPPDPSEPQFACLSKTTLPDTPLDLVSKNIFLSDSTGSNATDSSFCYYPYNQLSKQFADSQPPTESVSSLKGSVDFATAKLIFESMHY